MPTIQAPPPLSQYNTYTSWPGGIDPSVRLYRTGGKRKNRTRKTQNRKKNTRKKL